MKMRNTTGAIAAVVLAGASVNVAAESDQVRFAQQFGLSYLPMHVVVDRKLVETCAKDAGLGDVEDRNRIGETTYRSALPEGYRYGNRSVRDWTEGRHFSVIVMHFGACKGGTHARTMARQV